MYAAYKVAGLVPFLVAETGYLIKTTEGRAYLAPWLRVGSITWERHVSRSLRQLGQMGSRDTDIAAKPSCSLSCVLFNTTGGMVLPTCREH